MKISTNRITIERLTERITYSTAPSDSDKGIEQTNSRTADLSPLELAAVDDVGTDVNDKTRDRKGEFK